MAKDRNLQTMIGHHSSSGLRQKKEEKIDIEGRPATVTRRDDHSSVDLKDRWKVPRNTSERY